MKKMALIDIDGTLVSITRSEGNEFEGIIPFGEEYWNEWNKTTVSAKELIGGIEMVKQLKKNGYVIVGVTVRGSSARKLTIEKLKQIGVWNCFDGLWFRPLVCERWYWKKEKNAERKDWRNGQKWSSDQVKDYLIPIIEKKMNGKFVIALEDENHEVMKKHRMEVIDAKRWW